MGLDLDIKAPGENTVLYRFDSEKIGHCVDYLNLLLRRSRKKNCQCSPECIRETIRFLNVTLDRMEELEKKKQE